MAVYLPCVLLFLIGVYCVTVKRNLIKIIIGLIIMEYSVNLFLIMLGYANNGVADPLPQSMALMLIAVGLSTTIIMTSIAMRIYESYGTFDISKIRKLRG